MLQYTYKFIYQTIAFKIILMEPEFTFLLINFFWFNLQYKDILNYFYYKYLLLPKGKPLQVY